MFTPTTSVDGGTEMPSYQIRHSIATKVAAKKTAKGYTLSDESCSLCEMPLMTLKGKSDCKVCPAIKKWVQRKNEANGHNTKQVSDARDMVVETAAAEEDTEIRDKAPAADSNNLDHEKAQLEDSMKVEETLSGGSDESEDTERIRSRARQIIMNARDIGGGLVLTNSNENHLSWDPERMTFSDESIEETCIQNRAEEIINQARKDLQAELVDDFPEELLSPRMADDPGVDDVDGVYYSERLAAVVSPRMGTWEAAIIIQAVGRRFLVKKSSLAMESLAGKYEINSPRAAYVNYYKEDWENDAPIQDPGIGQEEKQCEHSSAGDTRAQQYYSDNQDIDQHGGFKDSENITYPDPPPNRETYNDTVPGQFQVSMPDYAAAVPVSKQMEPPTSAPSRGLLAQLACKFDDAVTDAIGKVHSIVTCSMEERPDASFQQSVFPGGSGEVVEGKSSQFKKSSFLPGQDKKHDSHLSSSTQAIYDAQVMLLKLRGWRVANASCKRCNRAWMVRPEDGELICAACDDVLNISEEQKMRPVSACPPRPESLAALSPKHLVNHPAENHDYSVNRSLYNTEKMKRRLEIFSQRSTTAEEDGDDMKENVDGGAEVTKQLEEAKLRIEEAKQFITRRNSKPQTTQTFRADVPQPTESPIAQMPDRYFFD